MQYLHYSLDLGSRDVVQVELQSPAHVRLVDDTNYEAYREGKNYRYFGGLAEKSPANIKPPHQGHWHLCVDLGDKDGKLSAIVHIIQEVAPDQKRGKRTR